MPSLRAEFSLFSLAFGGLGPRTQDAHTRSHADSIDLVIPIGVFRLSIAIVSVHLIVGREDGVIQDHASLSIRDLVVKRLLYLLHLAWLQRQSVLMTQDVLCFLLVLLLLIFLHLLYFVAFISSEDQVADASEDEGEHQRHRH